MIRCHRCSGRQGQPALAAELTVGGSGLRGHCRSPAAGRGFSLQGNAKTIEGKRHPGWDFQFRYISEQASTHQAASDHRGHQEERAIQGFPQRRLGMAAGNGGQKVSQRRASTYRLSQIRNLVKPFLTGVYDVAANADWVSIGTDHETTPFAVESIHHWWNSAEKAAFPGESRAAGYGGRGRVQQVPHPGVDGRANRMHCGGYQRDTGGEVRVYLPPLDERQRRLLVGADTRRWGMAGSGWWPGLPGLARPRYRWASAS